MFLDSKYGCMRKRYPTTEDKIADQQSRRWMNRNNDKAFMTEAKSKHSLFSGFGDITMLKTSHVACCGYAMGARELQNAVFLLGSEICFCG